MLSSCFKCTLQQGQPPLLPSVYNMEVVEVHVDRSSTEIQAWLNLKTWRPCTTISREVETYFQQEGSSSWISRNLVLKNTLSFQPDSKGKWMPNDEGSCAVKKYFVKIYNKSIKSKNKQKKSSISRKPEKAT